MEYTFFFFFEPPEIFPNGRGARLTHSGREVFSYGQAIRGGDASKGDPRSQAAACDKAVTLGRVAPPRDDVMCVSGGVRGAVAAVLFFVAVVVALAMP